jgi:hypothetical protein
MGASALTPRETLGTYVRLDTFVSDTVTKPICNC